EVGVRNDVPIAVHHQCLARSAKAHLANVVRDEFHVDERCRLAALLAKGDPYVRVHASSKESRTVDGPFRASARNFALGLRAAADGVEAELGNAHSLPTPFIDRTQLRESRDDAL